MARCFFLAGGVLGLLLALPGAAQPQDNSSQSQQSQSSSQSQSQAGNPKKDQKKSTAQENPFPEDKSQAAARQAQQQEQREEQDEAPAAPAPQTAPKGSTAAHNPFPEAQSEKAAGQDGFSSSQVKGLELPSTSGGASPAAKPGFNPELAKQDNKVGGFYLQTGDWKGAYDRFLEASQVDPGSAEAVYGLGESAAHLGKRNEALRQFRLYLSALPEGPHAKDIRKEMKKMGVEPPK